MYGVSLWLRKSGCWVDRKPFCLGLELSLVRTLSDLEGSVNDGWYFRAGSLGEVEDLVAVGCVPWLRE